MITQVSQRLSIFPLAGALLFPRLHLPLHIFEPRYRAMVSDALARDRRIAMIQPRDGALVPELFDVGCVGRIAQVEALDDGRYNIVLEGIARFRIRSEIDATTPFRQVEADSTGSRTIPTKRSPMHCAPILNRKPAASSTRAASRSIGTPCSNSTTKP